MFSMGELGALLARNASSFLVFLSISNSGSISLETGISGSILENEIHHEHVNSAVMFKIHLTLGLTKPPK